MGVRRKLLVDGCRREKKRWHLVTALVFLSDFKHDNKMVLLLYLSGYECTLEATVDEDAVLWVVRVRCTSTDTALS